MLKHSAELTLASFEDEWNTLDNRQLAIQMFMKGYSLGYYDAKPRRRNTK